MASLEPEVTEDGLARFGTLGPAERVLIDGLDSGALDRLGPGGLPDAGDETRRVRADLLRYLLIGGPGAPKLHEKGIRLSGAWIVGPLDLWSAPTEVVHQLG